MPEPTSLLVTLSLPLAKTLIEIWTGDNKIANEIMGGTFEWLINHGAEWKAAKKAKRVLDELADEIAGSLQPIFEHEAQRLDAGEQSSAIRAVIETLKEVPPDAPNLVDARMDPITWARRVTEAAKPRTIGLSADGRAFYERLVEEISRRLIAVADRLPAFQPHIFAQILADGSQTMALARETLERVLQIEKEVAQAQPESRDATFERRYRDALVARLDRVEMFGASVELRPYPLSTAYIDLEVCPNDDTSELHLEYRSGHHFLSVAMSNARHIYIQGAAGSGKTTLLQWFAVRLAVGDTAEQLGALSGLLPFFVHLRTCGSDFPTPERLVSLGTPMLAGVMPDGWAHRVLESGRALLLVDGIDELPEEDRPSLVTWLHTLRNTFPNLRVVISSRPLVDDLDLNLPTLRHLQMKPMRPDQVEAFIARWHEAVSETLETTAQKEELILHQNVVLKQIRSRSTLRRLTDSPLLCALLCAINKDRRGVLPENRVEIYDAAVHMLLDRRDRERKIVSHVWNSLSYTKKQALLSDFAWWMLRNDLVEVSKEESEVEIKRILDRKGLIEYDGATLLDLLVERSGLLRFPAKNRVDFVHKSFLEHLAARGAIDNNDVQQVLNKAHLDGWREVVLHLTGIASQHISEIVVTGLLSRANKSPKRRLALILLAGAILQETPGLSNPLRDRVREALNGVELPYEHNITPWVRVGDMAVSHLTNGFNAPVEITRGCVRALIQIGSEMAMNELIHVRFHQDYIIKSMLITAIENFTENSERYKSEILAHVNLKGITINASDFIIDLPGVEKLKFSIPQQSKLISRLSEAKECRSVVLSFDKNRKLNFDIKSLVGTGLLNIKDLSIDFGGNSFVVWEYILLEIMAVAGSVEVLTIYGCGDNKKPSLLGVNKYHNSVRHLSVLFGYIPDNFAIMFPSVTTIEIHLPMENVDWLVEFKEVEHVILRMEWYLFNDKIHIPVMCYAKNLTFIMYLNRDIDLSPLSNWPNLERIFLRGNKLNIPPDLLSKVKIVS